MLGPFHEGEHYVQERAGERDAATRNGGLIGDSIPQRAIPFLAQQRMLAVGTVDEHGAPAASLLFGAHGMVSSADGQSVAIDRSRIDVNVDDPIWSNLRVGADVGLLAIELATRRRLRINGVVSGLDTQRIDVAVRQAYPNCPKYIQRRHLRDAPGVHPAETRARAIGNTLDDARSRRVEQADTLFVASRHPTRGVDVSHRGGEPGFVRIVDLKRLRIPDYPGNGMFNTLGNFAVDHRASLVFLDFDDRSLLQMTGTVDVHFDEAEDPRYPTGGSGRYWDFHVTHWLALPIAASLEWELLDASPYNPRALD